MPGHVDRRVLPIPDPHPVVTGAIDMRDAATSFAPIEPLRPPAGAPNVLVNLLDEVGPASSSVFGGPVATPAAERLAGAGLRYTRYAADESIFRGTVEWVRIDVGEGAEPQVPPDDRLRIAMARQ